jgi:hypothetical protein
MPPQRKKVEPEVRPVVKGRAYPKDPELLSRNPKAVRARLRRANADMNRDVEALLPKPLDEWDLEELAHGRPRDKNGTFLGAKGKWITPKVQEEIKKRLITKTFGDLSLEASAAIKTVHKLMTSDEVDYDGKPIVTPSVRLDAAKFVIEQIIGKATKKIDIEEGSTLHTILASALVNPDGRPAHPVIEGQIVEYEDDDAGDD